LIKIIQYDPSHQVYFEQLHRTWFTEHFHMQPETSDEFLLTQPQKAILQLGGAILVAKIENTLAGTVALKKQDEEAYELLKMAVQKEYRGMGVGMELVKAAIRKAKFLGAKKIILYSHSSLHAAVCLYKKVGFSKIALESGTCNQFRCDVKMELTLDQT